MIHLNYKTFGEGKPLVVLHGLFGSLDNWMSLGRKFSEFHKVILLDQRNHGQSEHTEEFSYELLADDLRDLMMKEGIENPVLLGHSMGGKTVMNFALRYPELAERIIVVDSAPKKYPVHHDGIIRALKSLDFETIKNRKEVDEKLAQFIPELSVRQFLSKSIYWKQPERLALRFNLDSLSEHIETISDWELELKNESVPTLFIRGGRSNYILPDEDSLGEHFGNFELQTIEDAGHWVHAEKPQKLFDEVRRFTS